MKRRAWGEIGKGALQGAWTVPGWIIEKTNGIRGYVGVGLTATGGSFMSVAFFSSGPPGWVMTAGIACTAAGGALIISDIPAMAKDIQNIKEWFKDQLAGRSEMIDETDKETGGWGKCPQENKEE